MHPVLVNRRIRGLGVQQPGVRGRSQHPHTAPHHDKEAALCYSTSLAAQTALCNASILNQYLLTAPHQAGRARIAARCKPRRAETKLPRPLRRNGSVFANVIRGSAPRAAPKGLGTHALRDQFSTPACMYAVPSGNRVAKKNGGCGWKKRGVLESDSLAFPTH